jgi:hypothetical protein
MLEEALPFKKQNKAMGSWTFHAQYRLAKKPLYPHPLIQTFHYIDSRWHVEETVHDPKLSVIFVLHAIHQTNVISF